MVSTMLSYHHGVVYLIRGNHAYESNQVSVGVKVKPSTTDRKEKTRNTIM